MNKLTKKQKGVFIGTIIAIFIIGLMCGMAVIMAKENSQKTNTNTSTKNDSTNTATAKTNTSTENDSTNTSAAKAMSTQELANLKAQVEKDEADYGNNYQTLTHTSVGDLKAPDRIYFKAGNEDGFYLFEKNDENYAHVLEMSEDRMTYSVYDDYNLYAFTPDSMDTIMTSGDNYIIFDYDNGNLNKDNPNFQKDIIFRFSENTRLYRLLTYLSYYKDMIPRGNLGKSEFASDTNISGYKYMMSNNNSDD